MILISFRKVFFLRRKEFGCSLLWNNFVMFYVVMYIFKSSFALSNILKRKSLNLRSCISRLGCPEDTYNGLFVAQNSGSQIVSCDRTAHQSPQHRDAGVGENMPIAQDNQNDMFALPPAKQRSPKVLSAAERRKQNQKVHWKKRTECVTLPSMLPERKMKDLSVDSSVGYAVDHN